MTYRFVYSDHHPRVRQTLLDGCTCVRWQAQLDSLQSQLARQGESNPTPRAEAAVLPSSGMLSDAIAATLREVDALVAAAHERSPGEAADLEALTALLRSALADR